MLNVLILTAALSGQCENGTCLVDATAAIVSAPMRVAARVVEAQPARKTIKAPVRFFRERKPARQAVARLADRVRQRPMLARRVLFPRSR